MAYRIALIGGGGVGKTTLAYAFSGHARKQGLETRVANLDPAAHRLPYAPCFDIRDYYSLRRVMREHKLGPGGGLKKIYADFARNAAALRAFDAAAAACDWLLCDTAGSLELFMLEGRASLLARIADAVLFVVDNEAAANESDLLLLKALSATQELKYARPTLCVINKSDLLEKKQKRNTRGARSARGNERAPCGARLLAEFGESEARGSLSVVDDRLRQLLSEVGRRERVVQVSAWERTGLGVLADALHELRCECGDSS
ncbi:MAG: ATP/GTP-binding protein [Candidatus Norongarragalinales archaeon]